MVRYVRCYRSSHPKRSSKQLFLNISLYLQENTCGGVYLIQLQDLIKKRFQHQCFPVIIACEIFKNFFFRATPLVTASVFNSKNIPVASVENKRVLLELKLFVETQRETLVKCKR